MWHGSVTQSELAAEVLRPYVPRLLISWLRESPEERHRPVDGTLAFVDISGFTQLTERLARKGKMGSEEISDTLDGCFGELLSLAYDYGAGVVKWGGDAVLLLFTDDDHAARACRASWGMHELLRRIGNLQTSAGRVRLRMSVGVHSGSFDFFLAGGLHRELILVGPAATTTIAMESTADAGETVVSPRQRRAARAGAARAPERRRLPARACARRRPAARRAGSRLQRPRARALLLAARARPSPGRGDRPRAPNGHCGLRRDCRERRSSSPAREPRAVADALDECTREYPGGGGRITT